MSVSADATDFNSESKKKTGMRFPKWVRTAAFVLTDVATIFGVTPGLYAAHNGKTALQDTVKSYVQDDPDIGARMASRTMDKATSTRLREDMDIYSGLLFYCGPHIAHKVAGYKSADNSGNGLIQQQKDGNYVVWQADHGRFDTLENIQSVIDPDTKLQMCATYNVNTNDMVVSWGGTDFTSPKDLAMASASAFGGVTPRAAAAGHYMCEAIDVFMEKHPGVTPNLSFVAHSAGGASVPAAMIAAESKGFHVNEALIMAGFGSKKAFEVAAEASGIPMETLTQNVVSICGSKKGPLDMFTAASASVGKNETCAANGHMGKNFVDAWNKKVVENKTP